MVTKSDSSHARMCGQAYSPPACRPGPKPEKVRVKVNTQRSAVLRRASVASISRGWGSFNLHQENEERGLLHRAIQTHISGGHQT